MRIKKFTINEINSNRIVNSRITKKNLNINRNTSTIRNDLFDKGFYYEFFFKSYLSKYK